VTSDPRPLIVTAEFDPAVQGWLEGLRRAHYPAELNRVPAHLTLFHALPGSAQGEVARRLATLAGQSPPLAARLAGVKSLGRGVAIRVECRALDGLRKEVAEALWLLLSAQDRAGVQLHVTVQNKAEPTAVRHALASLQGLAEQPTHVAALRLWRYLGGPWEALGRWPFRGRAA
jgi:2'-5' RNA ligase